MGGGPAPGARVRQNQPLRDTGSACGLARRSRHVHPLEVVSDRGCTVGDGTPGTGRGAWSIGHARVHAFTFVTVEVWPRGARAVSELASCPGLRERAMWSASVFATNGGCTHFISLPGLMPKGRLLDLPLGKSKESCARGGSIIGGST